MDIHNFNKLPQDVLCVIMSYDSRFKYRNGDWIYQIPKNDERYRLLKTINRVNIVRDKISHIVIGPECHLTIFWDYSINNREIDCYYRFVKNKCNMIYKIK